MGYGRGMRVGTGVVAGILLTTTMAAAEPAAETREPAAAPTSETRPPTAPTSYAWQTLSADGIAIAATIASAAAWPNEDGRPAAALFFLGAYAVATPIVH